MIMKFRSIIFSLFLFNFSMLPSEGVYHQNDKPKSDLKEKKIASTLLKKFRDEEEKFLGKDITIAQIQADPLEGEVIDCVFQAETALNNLDVEVEKVQSGVSCKEIKTIKSDRKQSTISKFAKPEQVEKQPDLKPGQTVSLQEFETGRSASIKRLPSGDFLLVLPKGADKIDDFGKILDSIKKEFEKRSFSIEEKKSIFGQLNAVFESKFIKDAKDAEKNTKTLSQQKQFDKWKKDLATLRKEAIINHTIKDINNGKLTTVKYNTIVNEIITYPADEKLVLTAKLFDMMGKEKNLTEAEILVLRKKLKENMANIISDKISKEKDFLIQSKSPEYNYDHFIEEAESYSKLFKDVFGNQLSPDDKLIFIDKLLDLLQSDIKKANEISNDENQKGLKRGSDTETKLSEIKKVTSILKEKIEYLKKIRKPFDAFSTRIDKISHADILSQRKNDIASLAKEIKNSSEFKTKDKIKLLKKLTKVVEKDLKKAIKQQKSESDINTKQKLSKRYNVLEKYKTVLESLVDTIKSIPEKDTKKVIS